MQFELASPNEKEKKMMEMRQYQAQAGPLAQREKGMGEQMGDMVKQRAMQGTLDAGQEAVTSGIKPYMQSITNAINPIGSAGAGAVAGQAATNAAMSSTPALMGMGGAQLGAGAATGAAGAGGMAALGTAVPYIGAAMLADQALGLGIMDSFFSDGGQVGPLSPQYKSQGGMTEADARALMNNQPAINFPDPEELLQEMSMPTPRPQIENYGADRTFSPYDMIRPDNAPNT